MQLSCIRAVPACERQMQLHMRRLRAGAPQEAIQRLRMGNAVKVLLAFKEPCWPTGLWDAVCPGAFLPELWVTSYPAADPGVAPHLHPHPSPPCPPALGLYTTKV